MDLVAEAKLPTDLDSFRGALNEFVGFIRDRCVPTDRASIHLSLHEKGCKANQLLAEALPADARVFVLGPVLDLRKTVSATQFLSQIHPSPPSRSYGHVTLTDFVPFGQALALVERAAQLLPPSGRGITFMLSLQSLSLRGAPEAVRADLMLARWQGGPQRKAASVRIICPAQSKSDRAAQEALRAVEELLGLRFGKRWTQHPLGGEKARPDANALWIAHKSFQAAFDLTTLEVEENGLKLDGVALLFPRFEAFGKRIWDVQRGKHEKIDLVSHLKRLVREIQAGYEFDQPDGECVIFRKRLSPSLDGLLNFERFHHHGLGKSFTLNFATEFPGNPEFQQHPVLQLFRESLFTVFHRNWDQPAWAYATSEELQQALQGCAGLLSRVLPLLERRLLEMLSPVPKALPSSIPSLGRLTAREAYDRALPLARSWANDVEPVSVSSAADLVLREMLGAGIEREGRVQAHGHWSVRLVSRHRAAHIAVDVPHTGAIRWATFSLPLRQGRFSTITSVDWLDSSAIAPTVNTQLEGQLGRNEYRVEECFYRLGTSQQPGSAQIVWEVHALLQGKHRYDRKDLRVIIDPWNGRVLEAHTEP